VHGVFKKAIVVNLMLLVIVSGFYPLAVWVVGQIAFHGKANGSIIEKNGTAVGSRLIGQNFKRPEYFHPRPSSAGDKGYDGANSSGSNLALTNKKFVDGLSANIKQVMAENPDLKSGRVPNDMVMGSASGLDPDISPANAQAQGARVATARGVSVDGVKAMIEKYTAVPDLGVLGEAYVNVLELNLALDESLPVRK
jgi:potassium-transporting ATPase KdpC subunit